MTAAARRRGYAQTFSSRFRIAVMSHSAAQPRKIAALLFFALVANAAGHSFVLVVLPGLARRLGVSDLQAGILIGLSALAATLAAPLWGVAGDRRGRRSLILAGLGAGAAFLAFAAGLVRWRLSGGIDAGTTFTALFAARFAQVCLGAGLMPAAQAVFADITASDRRAGGMGLMGAAFGIGSIAGGAFAWRMAADRPAFALALLAALVAVAALGVALRLPETRGGVAAVPPPLRFVRHLARFLAITLLALSAYAALQQVTMLRLQDGFGLAADAAMRVGGGMMMTAMAAMVVGQLLLARRLAWTPLRLSRVGAVVAAACLLAAAFAPVLPVLLAAMAGVGLGLGLLLPGNLAQISLRAGGIQAAAAGINALAQGLGMALGPIAGAMLHRVSPQAPYFVAALALACVAVLAWRAPKPFAD